MSEKIAKKIFYIVTTALRNEIFITKRDVIISWQVTYNELQKAEK